MIIIDSHLDLAWNALNWNRDLTLSVPEIRASESGMNDKARAANTVSFPEMRKGEVAICLGTVIARAGERGDPLLDYRNQEIAYAMAQGQFAYYRIMEAEGQLCMLENWHDVERHLGNWTNAEGGTRPLGLILSMEGADPIVSPSQIREWWENGLRVVGPVHYGSGAYAHGTGASGGLTSKGRDLLRAMEEVGMILDVTHLAEESFWQAVELFKGPILASHNNCRALVPGDRQFTDNQIRYLIDRGSVIGVALDAWMLYPGWVSSETTRSAVSLEAVVNHIDHICQLAGNASHAAIGSDLDGGFGIEQSPQDLDTISDLQKIPPLLQRRGYNEANVEGIMHANWLRFFREAWRDSSSA